MENTKNADFDKQLALMAKIKSSSKYADDDAIVTLQVFRQWSQEFGFKDEYDSLLALQKQGFIAFYRIQSGRVKIFFK